MDVTWWWVVIAACVALAAVIVAALALRVDRSTPLRPLANVERLTRLPAYIRARRRRTLTTVATLALLAVAFTATVVAAARPTGLPGPARDTATAQPEDVMVCTGAPADDPAIASTARYFAAQLPTFDTQRIGLSSADRRVIPLTRDYQYAATRFADFERTGEPPSVPYSDYSPTVEDAVAMCITGFPAFDRVEPQRRSVIYVGPGGQPNARPLFGVAALRQLAEDAGVQVNAVMVGSGSGVLEELARDTGGQYFAPNANVGVSLEAIRQNPPPATPAEGPTTRASAPETPEVPLLLALFGVGALLTLSLVRR